MAPNTNSSRYDSAGEVVYDAEDDIDDEILLLDAEVLDDL